MSKTGLFGFPLEENYNENVEEKEEESSSSEEEPEQEKEEETSSSEEEQEMDDDEPDPWKPLREKVGEDLEEYPTWKKFNSSWIREKPKIMPR